MYHRARFLGDSRRHLMQELQLKTILQQNGCDASNDLSNLISQYQRRCHIKHCVTNDVTSMHANPENNGASFQVATQFNTLQCSHSNKSPEHGINLKAVPPSQGAQCALACAPSLVYRHYKLPFAQNPGEAPALASQGQREKRQVNNLDLLEQKLGRAYWSMRNGCLETTTSKLQELRLRLEDCDRNALLATIKVGWVRDAEVVLARGASGAKCTKSKSESE